MECREEEHALGLREWMMTTLRCGKTGEVMDLGGLEKDRIPGCGDDVKFG